jgi:hypothetical protein
MIRHKFYQLMKSSPWNYIINITHIYMNKSIHINDSIPVTITHVQENRKSVKKKEKKKVLCGHNDHAGYICNFIQ